MNESQTTVGGEPWWVVVARYHEREYASAAVDAPTAEDAEAEGQRAITANEARVPTATGTPESIVRVTGPFPRHVPTDERERRPGGCGGCGLVRYCGNHPPTPRQTWFEEVGDDGHGQDGFECINCGTITWLPEDWMEAGPR